MNFENTRYDILVALRDTIVALDLEEFDENNIEARKTFFANGLSLPAIVISPVGIENMKAPAGQRVRNYKYMVSMYFLGNEDPTAGLQEQLFSSETVAAIFDYMGLAGVSEVQQCRIEDPDNYLPAAYRNNVDTARMVVACETCLTIGTI